jgi:hypothetical protein
VVKTISKALLVALIGLGSIAVVPIVKAGDAESCWGRCDTDAGQNIERDSVAAAEKTDTEACWGRCDTDTAQDAELYTWHDPAGKNEDRETTGSYSWDDPADKDERDTLVSYQNLY